MKHNTTSLINELEKSNTQIEFIFVISSELHSVLDFFLNQGFKISKFNGLTGIQSVEKTLLEYQYFRVLHFLYWGLTANNWKHDPIDKEYLEQLKERILNSYNSKPTN